MSTELLVPFALNAAGGIAATSDLDVQSQQHVSSLISTTPGERAMLPTYGIDLAGQLFRPNSSSLAPHVETDISQSFATWEPGIEILRVWDASPTGDLSTGKVTIDVDWSIPDQETAAPSGVLQATILVGGSVIDDSQAS